MMHNARVDQKKGFSEWLGAIVVVLYVVVVVSLVLAVVVDAVVVLTEQL